jgi:hypothetical protein
MKYQTLKHILLVAVCFMIYPSAPEAGENIEMGRFSLAVELGKDWKSTIIRETQTVIFNHHPYRSILVREVDASKIHSSFHSERWVADAYRRGEEADMISRGVMKGMYKLEDVSRFELKVDGKNLYAMTFTQLLKGYIGYGYLYLYFPNFKESNKFYVFHYFCMLPGGKAQEVSMKEFHSIIRGFNLQGGNRGSPR